MSLIYKLPNRRKVLTILLMAALPSTAIYFVLLNGFTEIGYTPQEKRSFDPFDFTNFNVDVAQNHLYTRWPPHLEPKVTTIKNPKESTLQNQLSSDRIFEPPRCLIQPDICDNLNAFPHRSNSSVTRRPSLLVIAVISAANHFDKRNAIRQTWGQEKILGGPESNITTQIMFVVGLPVPEDTDHDDHQPETTSSNAHTWLANESAIYRDILQSDFADTYANLTIKTLTMLVWFHARCAGADYLLKIDDDCLLNVERLGRYLASGISPQTLDIYGQVMSNMKPHREKTSKWFVSSAEYPKKSYPAFVAGPAYLLSRAAVIALRAAMANMTTAAPLLHLEDVFLTGVVANEAGVTRVTVNDFVGVLVVSRSGRSWLSCPAARNRVTFHGIRTAVAMRAVWRTLLERRVSCRRRYKSNRALKV